MDRENLRKEVGEWVEDGIISNHQAVEILARYDSPETGRSRVVFALSLVGAALVFVGVTWFLATNWNDLPPIGRGLVLIAGPGLAYAGGIVIFSRYSTRIGHALIILGAFLVAPSLFLLEDLLSANIANVWVFLGWMAIALPTGHSLDSRPGTAIGLVALTAVTVELTDASDPAPVVALLGIILFTLGYTRLNNAAWMYRVAGVTLTLGSLILITTLDGRFDRFELALTVPFIVGVLGSLLGLWWLFRRGHRYESHWTLAVLFAFTLSILTATFAPETLPGELGFIGTQLGALTSVAATGYLGYRTRSRAFIDIAVIGALFQTLSFVATTVVDDLSGAIALVVVGIVLLIIGLVLERGRRSILAQF